MTKHSRNLLYLIAKARGVNLTSVQKQLEISEPTASKYMREPKRMDGYCRDKLAALLKLHISVLDGVINGDYLEIEAVLVANKQAESQRVTRKTKI